MILIKKKFSDIVFQRVSPPDHKPSVSVEDLSHVLVRRLGLKRKESRARHDKLLLEMIKMKKDNMPMTIEQISQVLGVSQSQTYEEMRKWRTLGLLEFVKLPAGGGYVKGYMLTGPTMNRMLDRVESSAKSFLRRTRRIAKDFDDLLMLEMARGERAEKGEKAAPQVKDQNAEAQAEEAEDAEEQDTAEDEE